MHLATESWPVRSPLPGVFPAPSAAGPPVWLIVVLCLAAALMIAGAALAATRLWAANWQVSPRWAAGLVLAALVLAIGGLVVYDQRRPRDLAPRPRADEPRMDAANPTIADWPTDRGGVLRTGAAPGVDGPRHPRILWRYHREGEAFLGGAAVVGDRLFAIGSTERTGRIYEFDIPSGQVRWAVRPPDYRPTFAAPVVAGDRLYCGEGLHTDRQCRVVCLELGAAQVGVVRWMFTTQGHVASTPAVDHGLIYVGAGDDGWYMLRESPEGAPEVVNHGDPREFADVEASFAVSGLTALVGLGIGGQALVALDALDGHELERLKFDYPLFGSPAIVQGKAYLGMGQGDYLTPDSPAGGQLVCVNLFPLRMDWTVRLPGSVLGAVAAVDDELICGCSGGELYVVGRDGIVRHHYATGAPILASPAVTARHIYLVNGDGQLIALSRPDLKPVWSLRIGPPGRYTSSPVVSRLGVIVGTFSEGLLCIGEEEESP